MNFICMNKYIIFLEPLNNGPFIGIRKKKNVKKNLETITGIAETDLIIIKHQRSGNGKAVRNRRPNQENRRKWADMFR